VWTDVDFSETYLLACWLACLLYCLNACVWLIYAMRPYLSIHPHDVSVHLGVCCAMSCLLALLLVASPTWRAAQVSQVKALPPLTLSLSLSLSLSVSALAHSLPLGVVLVSRPFVVGSRAWRVRVVFVCLLAQWMDLCFALRRTFVAFMRLNRLLTH